MKFLTLVYLWISILNGKGGACWTSDTYLVPVAMSILGCHSAFVNFGCENNSHSVWLSLISFSPSLSVTGQVFPEGTRSIITAKEGQVSALYFSRSSGLQINIYILYVCGVLSQASEPTTPSWRLSFCHAVYVCLSQGYGQDAGLEVWEWESLGGGREEGEWEIWIRVHSCW